VPTSGWIRILIVLIGSIYQNAYVTRNMEKAFAAFAADADARSAVHFDATTEVLTAEGRKPHVLKLAFIWVGDFQYELIEPVSEAAPLFGPWLPDGDEIRFHHSCARVPDWDSFRERVGQTPYPVVLEGGGDDLKFLFLDTRDLLGHYMEYTWMTEASWQRIGGQVR
jgi:hypothetical protein